MDYMRVLKGAFLIAWKQKAIWLFAFLAIVFGAREPSPRFSYSFGYRLPADQELPQPFSELLGTPWIRSLTEHPQPFLVGLATLVLLASAIGLLGRSFTRGAMIAMVHEVERSGATSIASGARAGTRALAPILGVSILLAIPSVVLLIAILALALPVLYPLMSEVLSSLAGMQGSPQPPTIEGQYPAFEALSALFPSLFCLMGVAWVVGLATTTLERLSIRSCVLEHLGVIASIRRGWTFGLKYLGYVIITVVMFGIVAFVVGMAVAIPIMALSLASFISFLQDPQGPSNWSLIIIGSVYGLFASAIVGTLLTALVETAWTKLYMAGSARPSA